MKMSDLIEKEMYKPKVGYEMIGDKVFLIIPQSYDIDEHRLVMTKELFIACYEHWIKKIEDNMIHPIDRKMGNWIENINGTYSCSLCHSWIPKQQYPYARFCLFCGARMVNDND